MVGTMANWRSAGMSAKQMRSLLRSGDLVRMRYGVYATRAAVAAAMDDPRRRHALEVLAVTTSVGRDSVASHHSAARIHGLDLLRPAPADIVTLTRPRSRPSGRPRSDGIVFRVATLPREHVTPCWGVAVTSVPRTVVDLARTLSFTDAVVVADSALRLGKTTKSELSRVVNACDRWPGVDQARRTVAFADGRAESVLESCARVTFDTFGLEAPDLQVTFRGEGFVFRGDFYWARYRTIAEADGMAKYEDPQRARDQLRRDRLLRDAGYRVVHFTWREIFEAPTVVVARIRKSFTSATPF
jgi:predicted transcriptional regulator of viral defense system